MADDGRQWSIAVEDLAYVQHVEECTHAHYHCDGEGYYEGYDCQFTALLKIHHAIPLATGDLELRVYTSRGLVDFRWETRQDKKMYLHEREARGDLRLCGLQHTAVLLNPWTRALALEALVLGLAGPAYEDPLVRGRLPVIHTVELEHMRTGDTVALFSN